MEALSEVQVTEETEAPTNSQVILVLQKDGVTTIVRDFIYPFAPQTYYQRYGVLGVDMYELDHVKDDKAYYKYVEPEK